MFRFLKYIVFIFLTFNVQFSSAAEVIFEPFEDDEEELPVPNFTNASSLPHPVQMREILDKENTSTLGKLFMLARYFEARYPNTSLDLDFSNDIRLIFPEMNENQVQTTTKHIRTTIRLYRFGKEKIEEFKTEKLSPKDPPLVVEDDQYAIIGDKEYIETAENEVAVISDFKKVIGYGHNPREVEAFEAFFERKLKSKGKVTDFERFRTMIGQLDWSQITSYGTTKPSPFVGNAGIGSWIEQDSFRARLISDTARIGSKDTLMLGLHLKVPNHRFMLASSLSETKLKPKIELIHTHNVDSYEIFMPMPVQAISDKMIGAYIGDFAFPIIIKLKNTDKPLKLDAEITFENCDKELNCELLTLTPTIDVDTDDKAITTSSSMSNFIHQSLYNIPQPQSKYLTLEKTSYITDENNLISHINFEFKYRSKIKNLALFLENDDNTIFSEPLFIIHQNKIYAQVSVLENGANLLEKPLTLTARLNDFSNLRQTFLLTDFKNSEGLRSLKTLFVLGFLSAVLFYLMPFGFSLMLPAFVIKKADRNQLKFIAAKTIGLIFFATYFLFILIQKENIFYFDPTSHLLYLLIALVILGALLTGIPFKFLQNTYHPIINGLIYASLVVFMFPLFQLPYTQQFLLTIKSASFSMQAFASLSLLLGLIFPDICAVYLSKLKTHQKIKTFMHLLSFCMMSLSFICVGLWLLFLITPFSVIKIIAIFTIGILLLKYIFYFWDALYQTDLKNAYIYGTEKVLFILFILFNTLFVFILWQSTSIKINQTEQINFKEISQKIENGENLIISFQTPNCLVCRYNDLTVFNSFMRQKLKKEYNISYISINAIEPNQNTLEFLQQYQKLRQPLYIFYTALAPNGVVLPNLITPSLLNKTFENFNLHPSSISIDEALEKRRKTPRR